MANETSLKEAIDAAGLQLGGELVEVEDQTADLFGQDMEEEAAAAADQFGRGLAAVRGRGRPKGARNRTTRKTIELILASRRDPLMFLADIVAMRPAEVRALYGCEGAQALGHQISAAKELAGYIHSKKPTDVRVQGEGFVGVTIQLGAPGEAEPDLVGGREVEAQAAPIKISNTYEAEAEEVTQGDSHTDDASD